MVVSLEIFRSNPFSMCVSGVLLLWRRKHACTLGTLMGITCGKYSWHTHWCGNINEEYSWEAFVGVTHGALKGSTQTKHLCGTVIGSSHRGPLMESTCREDS